MLDFAATLAPAQDGDAQGIPNPFTTIWSGARELLRGMSYYEMKNRAGVIGKNGLGPLLAGLGRTTADPPDGPQLRRPPGLLRAGRPARRAHRIGQPDQISHLDPGRVLALHVCLHAAVRRQPGRRAAPAAAPGWTGRCWPPSPPPIGPSDGGIRRRACSPAKTTRRPTTSPTGGEPWGTTAISNSPHPIEIPLAPTGKPYDFTPGQFYKLDANAIINTNQSAFSGAHSDIRHPEVLWAVASAANLAG